MNKFNKYNFKNDKNNVNVKFNLKQIIDKKTKDLKIIKFLKDLPKLMVGSS